MHAHSRRVTLIVRAGYQAGLPTAVVTGASSGIGKQAAQQLADQGWNVYAGCRSSSAADELTALHPRITPLFLDVTSDSDVREAAASVSGTVGVSGIDALVNNAGIAITGPVETVPMDDIRQQFDINLFGVLRMTQEFLPLLRQGKAPGRIVNVSSVVGNVTLPYWSVYCASKHALESISDGLRIELQQQGIKVVLVKPGPVKTPNFWGRTVDHADGLRAKLSDDKWLLYGDEYAKFEAGYLASLEQGCTDRDVADAILAALAAAEPRARYCVGPSTGLLIGLKRALPDAAWDAFVNQLPAAARAGDNGRSVLSAIGAAQKQPAREPALGQANH